MEYNGPAATHRRWLALALTAVVAFVALLLIAPEGAPFLRCPFKMMTGLDCPGCGSQRALQALFHGHLSQAWAYNPLTLIGLPIVALYLALEAVTHKQNATHRLYRVLYSTPAILAWLVIIIAWWVFRNI